MWQSLTSPSFAAGDVHESDQCKNGSRPSAQLLASVVKGALRCQLRWRRARTRKVWAMAEGAINFRKDQHRGLRWVRLRVVCAGAFAGCGRRKLIHFACSCRPWQMSLCLFGRDAEVCSLA
mmetsp:Transcript_66734/g.169153  ORF Transcript_66734/g.169153 Transcript_66734/m.169153 type:complete len:121 (-) Transcript_66734:150-512(-)